MPDVDELTMIFLTFKKNALRILTISLFYMVIIFPVTAQEVGPSVMIGTQFPLQYTVGFNYPLSPTISARAQVGLLTRPYDRIVLKAMEGFGLDKNLSRTIENSLQNGLMTTLGANYHFSKNYVGLYGQYAHLRGETNLAEAASAYFGRDLSFLNPFGVSILELTTRSNLYNVGLLYGRRFTLPNPRLEILAEAGFGKILGSSNTFTTNQALIERIPLVQQLYKIMDRDFNDAYRKHGFLPSINIYLTYQF